MKRSIQIGGISTNGILRCKIRSFEKGPTYEIGVRLDNGLVHCTCPHFEHRCLKFHPTLWSPKICKHLTLYRETLIRERRHRLKLVAL